MGTNLLWKAGSRAPPVNYTLSAESGAETMAAHPDEREKKKKKHGERGKKGDGFSRVAEMAPREIPPPPSPAGRPRHSAHGLHFHHPMKYTNAIIIANMVAGMHNSSLLAAQPAPTQFSLCVGGELSSI